MRIQKRNSSQRLATFYRSQRNSNRDFPLSKRYLLTFPDGSKRHISRSERDTLQLSQKIRLTAAGNYFWCGQVRTFHSFSELKQLETVPAQQLKKFLAGFFIFEHNGQRKREFLES